MMRNVVWGTVAFVLAACQGPTQLLVVVDSDLGPELVAVSVVASAGAVGTSHEFEIEATGLPFSFGVARSSEHLENVTVGVSALSTDGVLLSHRVDTRFVPGRTVVVEVPLARACMTEPTCEERDQRCVFGACVEREVDPEGLPESVDDPLRGLFDGHRDPADAGVAYDAATPDACVDGAPCVDPGNPCMRGERRCAASPPTCELSETLPEGTPCAEGRVCNGMGTCGRI